MVIAEGGLAIIIRITRASLVAQWLRLHAAQSGGPGSIPGQGIRSHMLKLKVHML